MPSANSEANVQVTLQGLQMVFAGAESNSCVVGVLGEVPQGHDFEIDVQQIAANGTPQAVAHLNEGAIKRILTIEVSNASQTGITRRKMDATINRQAITPNDPDSFRWVVDFENEIYQEPIGADKDSFVSLLTVNAGELVTRNVSTNKLIVKRPNRDEEVFGKVATETGVDIVLDLPESKAVFKNGDDIVFEADAQSKFVVTLKRICNANQTGIDAESFYTAVGSLVPDKEKIRFSATPLGAGGFNPINANPADGASVAAGPFNTPDARCMVATMSRTKP